MLQYLRIKGHHAYNLFSNDAVDCMFVSPQNAYVEANSQLGQYLEVGSLRGDLLLRVELS